MWYWNSLNVYPKRNGHIMFCWPPNISGADDVGRGLYGSIQVVWHKPSPWKPRDPKLMLFTPFYAEIFTVAAISISTHPVWSGCTGLESANNVFSISELVDNDLHFIFGRMYPSKSLKCNSANAAERPCLSWETFLISNTSWLAQTLVVGVKKGKVLIKAAFSLTPNPVKLT